MARKFRFRLATVLEERKRQEDKKLQEWTLARNILSAMVEARDGLKRRLAAAVEQATGLAAAPENTSAQFVAMDAFIRGTKLKIQWKNQEIERGGKLTEKKRLEYVSASQKRMALEKIKDRRLEEYKERIRKREFKEIDDIYIMRSAWASERQEEEWREAGSP
ncbi:MAG: flagellar FliJ family protein [Deltaproteobacteria bacterium]|nr:flagellar FliJ family protein [Deltaproteobacteria bacterium]